MAKTGSHSRQPLMGNKPYAKPLGKNTAIGRAWLYEFGKRCRGDRLLNGEIMYRNKKIVDIYIRHRLMEGCTLEAHVATQDARNCKLRHGQYTTWLRVDPFNDAEREKALSILRDTVVWKALLRREGSIMGTAAPHRLLERLALDNKFLPEHRLRLNYGCDCGDDAPHDGANGACKHAAALCYELIRLCEVDPLTYLQALGIDLPRVLEAERADREFIGKIRRNDSDIYEEKRVRDQQKQRVPPRPLRPATEGPVLDLEGSYLNPICLAGCTILDPVCVD